MGNDSKFWAKNSKKSWYNPFGYKIIAKEEPRINAINYQQSTFGAVKSVVYGTNKISGNIIESIDLKAIPHTSTDSNTTGKGGASRTQSTTFTYTARILIGLCYGSITGIAKTMKDKTKTSLISENLNFFNGSNTQNPWGEMTTKHPERALAYKNLAYVAGNINLGASASVPQYAFEANGKFVYGGTIIDANPKDIIYDILTNQIYGAGYKPEFIDDLTNYSNFCIANGIFLSPVYNAQSETQKALSELAQITNSEFLVSQSKLKLIPVGDETIIGNGKTWTPDLTPVYDLNEDDFQNDEPIKCIRSQQADIYNSVKIEFLNRSNDYNIEVVEATNLANIELYGNRPADIMALHSICTPEIAKRTAQLALDRLISVRNQYQFKLSLKYMLLDPLDIVTLTYSPLGMDREPVRILKISEDNGLLSIEAEELVIGTASPAKYEHQESDRQSVDLSQKVGNINKPVIFEPPFNLTQNNLYIWAGVSSQNPFFGGAEIWVSDNGETYLKKGEITTACRQGILSEDLPAGESTDTENILSVDMSMSNSKLLSGTKQDADNLNTLCYVDGELLAYETANLTANNKYNLSYLKRGAYYSPILAHSANKEFARIDESAFLAIPFKKEDIGKQLYIKFTSFNAFGAGYQDLAEVEAYPYIIQGSALIWNKPDDVSGFTVNPDPADFSKIKLSWNANTDMDLKGYIVKLGADWSSGLDISGIITGKQFIYNCTATSNYKFMIKAVDKWLNESINAASVSLFNKIEPDDITGFIASQDKNDRSKLNLTWTASGNSDLSYYEVKSGNDWETGTTIATQKATQLEYSLPAEGIYNFLIKAINASGFISLNPAVINQGFTISPSKPQNGVIAQDVNNKSVLNISWQAIPEQDGIEYIVKNGTNWDTATLIATTKELSCKFAISTSATYNFLIKARNVSGYYSSALSLSKNVSVEPLDITGFSAYQLSADKSKVRLIWDSVTDKDFAFCEIREGLSWEVGTVIGAQISGLFFDTAIAEEKTYKYWIKAVNVAGKESQYPANATNIFSLEPTAPTGFNISAESTDKTNLILNWSKINDLDLLEYEIRRGGSWETAEVIGKTKELKINYKPAVTGDNTFILRAKNTSGFYSAETRLAYYATLEPASVQNFKALQNGSNVLMTWDKHSENDVIGYEIREGAIFDNGSLLITGLTDITYQTPVDTETTRKYNIKAINRAGKYSNSASTSLVTIANLPPRNVIQTYNEMLLQNGNHSHSAFGASAYTFANLGGKFSDYPTTKFSDIGGATVLKLALNGSIYYSSGEYACIVKDFGQIITANISSDFVSSALLNGVVSAKLQYCISSDNINFSEWQDFRPILATFRYLKFKVILATTDTSKTPEVNQFKVNIDVPDTMMRGSVTVAVGGSTINYGHSYYNSAYPMFNAVGTGLRAEIQSKGLTSAVVKILNTSNVDVGGTAIMQVIGF